MVESSMLLREEGRGERYRDVASRQFPDDPEVLLARGSWDELLITTTWYPATAATRFHQPVRPGGCRSSPSCSLLSVATLKLR
jgi:hypothetical protein